MKILKSVVLIFLIGCAFVHTASAQSKKSLFSIGQEKHYSEEFNYAYAKNNLAEEIKKDSIDSYLNLYINFRLKVKEAKMLGYDTTKVFKEEFELYKNQLEETYLSPKKEQEALVKEAYERSLREIRASHILIRVEPNSNDTLGAFRRITKIRERALAGEDFSNLAKTLSEDPSAKQNGGDLGYFTVFQMVYPFETAAYSTPEGSISQPVRTQFGYHLIKVVDKRANQGKIRVAHIMIRSTEKNAAEVQIKAKKKALMIDSLLKNGSDWNEICLKYSEDQNTLAQYGELKPFGRGQIVPEFEQAAFNLKNIDEISEPIQTQFGWHIIKLIGKVPVGTYDEEQSKLARKIKSDVRSSMPRAEMLKTLKSENGFYKNEDAVGKIVQLPPSVVINGQWSFDSTQLANSTLLFSIKEIKVSAGDFLTSVINSKFDKRLGVKEQLEKRLIEFEDSLVISFEKQQLSQKYPEYRFLIQEYYDGILLFSIMEDSIWKLSMKDSVGLADYYLRNKRNYALPVKDTTIFASNSKATLESLIPTVTKEMDKEEWDELKTLLLKENNESPLTLQIVSSEAPNIALIVAANVNELVEIENKWYWVRVADVLEYPKLNEIKGKVISDYQNFLDKNWIKNLKKKYPVKISKKSLNKVYAHFKAIE